MKQRYIDRLTDTNRSEEERDDALRDLLGAHLDAQTREQWAARLATEGVHRTPPAAALRLTWSRRLLAAAAVLVLALTAWWLWPRPESAFQLADRYVQEDGPLQLPAGFRGNTEQDAWRMAALEAYENRDYARALTELDALPLADSTAHADLLLRGLCYFFQGENLRAAESLEQAGQYSGALETERQWYLAMAYLRMDDAAKAQPLLERLAADTRSVYAARAGVLLEKMAGG